MLDRVANEVANHKGNVWSHVISLRREDAIRLGYDNSERWRELVKRHIFDIAEQTKISLCNLKWYAAYHDTTHHPHIHLIVYSTNPKQGFLTKQGIDKIRSAENLFLSEADKGNMLATHDLGKLYSAEKLGLRDEEKSFSYHKEAVIGDNIHAKYMLAKIFIGEEKYRNIPRAMLLLESIAEENNWASFMLGRLCLFGAEGFPKDEELAVKYLTMSAEQGNEYARNLLNHRDDFENAMLASALMSLFVNLSRCIGEDYNQRLGGGGMSVDRKLKRLILENKEAMGVKGSRLDYQVY